MERCGIMMCLTSVSYTHLVCCLGMTIGCGTNPSKNENVKETLPALVVNGTQWMNTEGDTVVLHGVSSVSYTHLDVYKRQPRNLRFTLKPFQSDGIQGLISRPSYEGLMPSMNCVLAVSYTHLDVYKRQVWY